LLALLLAPADPAGIPAGMSPLAVHPSSKVANACASGHGTSRALAPTMSKLVVAFGMLGALARDVRADGEPTASYVIDGGAVPLFWLPVVGSLVLDYEVRPRSTPLLFDPHGGGATQASWELPGWSLGVAGGGRLRPRQ
jgi:hypothetical protein